MCNLLLRAILAYSRAMSRFDLSRFLPFRINRIAERLALQMVPIYREELGLSRPEWRTLAHLGAEGDCSAARLGQLAAMDKVKVSRAVSALEQRGLIARRPDPDDRRASVLSLTAEGRAAFDRLTPLMTAGESRALAAMTPAQRAELERALAALEDALQITSPPPER